MNWTAFWILIGLTVLSIILKIINVLRRIITEEDVHRSWKADAIYDLIEAQILTLILIWMFYW